VRRTSFVLSLMFLAAAHSAGALADGFAAMVSPPRFELSAKPGATVRNVLEISNRATTPSRFRAHTADFSLTADYGVAFQETLQPGSCRPWVALERPDINLPGAGTIRYRFEVRVPPDTAQSECRFAILIESADPTLAQNGAVRLPVVGRIAVIVYLNVGNGQPQLEIFGPEVIMLNGQRLPALRVHNAGTAHGRMSGFLYGTDAKGVKYDFSPSDFPILPGEARSVFLTPSLPDNPHPTLTFPVSVHGTLEWGDQSTELNERFE
jgi:hypothetical protein